MLLSVCDKIAVHPDMEGKNLNKKMQKLQD